VLIGIHVLIAAHVTHFLVARRTLSPVEPSEAMYTLELGYVNAGFLFLLAALAATLVFGRFFCGWGCHLVALQDLCGWILRKIGIRPRPFRSRLLLLVPVGLAFYMFAWPGLRRLLLPGAPPFPGFTNHLVTAGFWDTFPGPLYAALTFLVCGFAAVYFLGAKGFCTYGCPYGALFAGTGRLAAGTIVVNESCEGCAHCTATCTSNVRVHEEVRRYGMVVDPGCMKCLDCVSVCPKDALRFAFRRPSLRRGRPPVPRRERGYDLILGEELLALAVCLGTVLAYRGLYDGPPLLLSVGLGGITAFLVVTLLRLVRGRDTAVQGLRLRSGGRMRPAGWLALALGLGWIALTAHSGFVQWHRLRGRHYLERTVAARSDVLSGAFAGKRYPESHRVAARRSLEHFRLADRWGLLPVAEVKLGMAWGHLLAGEEAAARDDIEAAIRTDPARRELHADLVELLLARGHMEAAIDAQRRKLRQTGEDPADLFLLGGLLVASGRGEEAVPVYRACLDLAPDSAEARYNLGGLLRRLGRPGEAVVQLQAAADLSPADFDAQVELGLALEASGRPSEAADALRRAIELEPDRPESRLHLPGVIERLERAAGGAIRR
jgi:polyferredoxin/tetratricopeptide (TPR) repeat protein